MATGLVAQVRATMTMSYKSANVWQGKPGIFADTLDKVFDLTFGTGDRQADIFFGDYRSPASGAASVMDLAGVLTDVFGATVTMAEVVAVLVVADIENTTSLTIGAGTAPIPLFAGADDTLILPPGGMFLAIASGTAGLCTVTATTADKFTVTNGSGATASFNVAIIGRSA